MRDQLAGLAEKADLAIASAANVLPEDVLDPLIDAVRAVRTRLAYPDDVLVVALAGGTGSGKSSLLNAIVGDDLVDAGGIRPTTSHPAAAVPSAVASLMAGYLDRLGVDDRHTHDIPGLCLLDLPDTDSVETEHRHRVDEILPLVDVVVWVTDPEKYRDARLHSDYLRPMSPYARQFIFVLNQVDRLDRGDAERVLDDLGTALNEDGILDPTVLAVSTSPPAGPPIGVEHVVRVLDEKRDDRNVLYEKLLTDLSMTAQRLSDAAGSPVEFDQRGHVAVSDAAEHLTAGDVDGATARLTSFLDQVAAEVGDAIGEEVRRLSGDVAAHLLRISTEVAAVPPRRWYRRSRSQGTSDLTAPINSAVIRPVRAVLARRALAVASAAELAVAAERLSQSRPG